MRLTSGCGALHAPPAGRHATISVCVPAWSSSVQAAIASPIGATATAAPLGPLAAFVGGVAPTQAGAAADAGPAAKSRRAVTAHRARHGCEIRLRMPVQTLRERDRSGVLTR